MDRGALKFQSMEGGISDPHVNAPFDYGHFWMNLGTFGGGGGPHWVKPHPKDLSSEALLKACHAESNAMKEVFIGLRKEFDQKLEEELRKNGYKKWPEEVKQ